MSEVKDILMAIINVQSENEKNLISKLAGEMVEIDEKIVKLDNMLENYKHKRLDFELNSPDLLKTQLEIMKAYSAVLAARINLLFHNFPPNIFNKNLS